MTPRRRVVLPRPIVSLALLVAAAAAIGSSADVRPHAWASGATRPERQQPSYASRAFPRYLQYYAAQQRNAERAFRALALVDASSWSSQLLLGLAADGARDRESAVTAYTAFLRRLPDGPLAERVRLRLLTLE